MLERLNEEIKRRTYVVRIFPNSESCLRLIRALAVEIHEGWLEAHRYLNMEDLREHRKEQLRLAAWDRPVDNAAALPTGPHSIRSPDQIADLYAHNSPTQWSAAEKGRFRPSRTQVTALARLFMAPTKPASMSAEG